MGSPSNCVLVLLLITRPSVGLLRLPDHGCVRAPEALQPGRDPEDRASSTAACGLPGHDVGLARSPVDCGAPLRPPRRQTDPIQTCEEGKGQR